MPAIKLTGAKSGTRSAPARKAPARRGRCQAGSRTRKPAAKAAAPAATNGGATRGPKLPEGWSQRDFNGIVKEMQKARTAREDAAEKLAEKQKVANDMALELLQEGIQMSVISTELDLSRQWLYTLMEKNGITPARAQPKPALAAAHPHDQARCQAAPSEARREGQARRQAQPRSQGPGAQARSHGSWACPHQLTPT